MKKINKSLAKALRAKGKKIKRTKNGYYLMG